jgi:hypothetical protein
MVWPNFVISVHADEPEIQDVYLGRKPPGTKPRLFLSSKHRIHSAPAISPDKKEIFWSVFPRTNEYSTRTQVILYSRFVQNRWLPPKLAPFSGRYFDGGPVFSHDGRRLYFYSRRPLDKKSHIQTRGEIWYVERVNDGWGEPRHHPLDFKGEKLFFSLSKNGNLYFTSGHGPRGTGSGKVDLYIAEFKNGTYMKPKRLPAPLNSVKYLESDVLVSPDETYLIFFSLEKPGNLGQYDLYVSFKTNNQWSIPANLGPKINKGYSRFPGFSPDGRYLFLCRREGTYWVRTEIIDEIKQLQLNKGVEK